MTCRCGHGLGAHHPYGFRPCLVDGCRCWAYGGAYRARATISGMATQNDKLRYCENAQCRVHMFSIERLDSNGMTMAPDEACPSCRRFARKKGDQE